MSWSTTLRRTSTGPRPLPALFGAWRLTQALLPLLWQSPSPRIVSVSSGAGSHDDPAFGLRARGGAPPATASARPPSTPSPAHSPPNSPILANSVCPGLTATWPGAEDLGARSVADSVPGIVWAATLPDDSLTGGFFRDTRPLPW